MENKKNATLRLIVRAQGSGPPLVLLHGGMGSSNHWIRNIDVLAGHFTVYAPDLPGYGDSPSIPRDIHDDDYVSEVIEALDAIVPDGVFRLVGFSFGGIIAAMTAARLGARVCKLSLLGAGGFGKTRTVLDLRKIPPESEGREAIRAVLRHNLCVMMCADPDHVTDETIDLHYANVRRTRFDGRHVSVNAGLMARSLVNIKCPVQMIWGDKDALCHPDPQHRIDESRKAKPDVRIDLIPGAGHWVQYEAAETVNRLLLEFMRDG